MDPIILTINPGSTSTKLALFRGEEVLAREELFLDAAAVSGMTKAAQQLDLRTAQVKDFLAREQIDPATFDMIVARGGPIPTCQHNCYRVNQLMLDTMVYAPMVEHASALACMIGYELAKPYGTPVIIYDPSATDEFDPIAKVTGLPDLEIRPVSHLLNTRMVAREAAQQLGKAYNECCFIVAHLGGGISVNAHRYGRVVDAVYDDMGGVSPQRVGRIPNRYINDLAAKYTPQELSGFFSGGKGGLVAWFGTQDIRVVEKMADEGNEKAKLVYDAMTCGVAKSICEMAAVLSGNIDAVILTGGVARSQRFTSAVLERITFLPGEKLVIPGEREMEALNRGGQRVLKGEEIAYDYDITPAGYNSVADFYAAIGKKE
jgi:butyrate kinase